MKQTLKFYLFNKNILVGKEGEKNTFHVLFTLAKKFGIHITEGYKYVDREMISSAAECLGEHIPEPFYRGFPETVKRLTTMELLFDQLLHYYQTYGLEDFSNPGRSVFEDDFSRLTYNVYMEPKNFVAVSEEEALARLKGYMDELLLGTRPLNTEQYEALKEYIEEYGYEINECNCKDTLIRLLLDTRLLKYAKSLYLSDVIKLIERLNYEDYGKEDIKKLNLKNKDRKFIAKLIDYAFENGRDNIRDCFEKKALWCGILHHIHYKPQSPRAVEFCNQMRGDKNESVFSKFESLIAQGDICQATDYLIKAKGESAALRSLNYIISRCKDVSQIEYVASKIKSDNIITLMQLLLQYECYEARGKRTFRFSKFNLMKLHSETPKESEKRKSVLDKSRVRMLKASIKNQLKNALSDRLGRVYISEKMKLLAYPINESTSNGGYGTLPKGTRLPLEDGKKIRCFTYWKGVDDIDLSVIGICSNGTEREFSWRTMFALQSDAITFSGDQTSGFEGGVEYFDIDFDEFDKKYPDVRYLVFCDNVYSNLNFSQCECKAGYMMRDVEDTGEIFEPKTVKSSFTVNNDSTYAYLFAVDLRAREFIWLNLAIDSQYHVAANINAYESLKPYFKAADVLSLKSIVRMMAKSVVKSPERADVIFTDEAEEMLKGKEIIHSYDTEKLIALINKK